MATKNDITGDAITSKISTQEYRDNYEEIFRKMTWRYWAKYEGLNYDNIQFDKSDLNDDDRISYTEFKKRVKV